MNKMKTDQLLDNLKTYGYPLLKPAFNKPEELLENLLEQDDARFLEGFPVVFTNMLKENEEVKWETGDWNPSAFSSKVRTRLPFFLALSFVLLQFNKMGKDYEKRTLKMLSRFSSGNKVLARVSALFSKFEPVKLDGMELSTERFENAY